ncbi:MAG: prepilin-type N-terminal cleavage/methylation domain-containing protein [Clostridia bacterium]|nr:prepilin-type N-terminal cleavage/methylation domain-containing protein [Clostridia bacterium]
MKIIKKTNNKHGFTLLEVMLAIAIMMITFEAIFSLIISVYNSHREVSYMNGATELLELNSIALEKSVLGFAGSSASSITYGTSNAVITAGGTKLFDLDSVTKRGGGPKFSISVTYNQISSEEIEYKIVVNDLEYNEQYGSISNTIWIPHANGKITISASGSTLTLSK